MRLTQWTDYTLRVLMYCAGAQGRAAPVTITEIAETYDISRSHLTKIVQQLGASGLLETSRGRGGGMRLVRSASDINLGAVVRATETDFHLVECFDEHTSRCSLVGHCGLKGVLAQAMHAFMRVLDSYSLADLMKLQDAPAGAEAQIVQLLHPIPPLRNAPASAKKPALLTENVKPEDAVESPVSGETNRQVELRGNAQAEPRSSDGTASSA